MTDAFRNRVSTNVVAVQQRDPAALRSGVVDGIAQIGDALGRAAARDEATQAEVEASRIRVARIQQDRARSSTIATRLGDWPDVQVKIANQLDDLRNSTDANAPDYQEKADAIVTNGLQEFRATLGDDPEVVERFAPLMGTFAASTRQGERRYAMAARAKAQGAGVDKWADAEGVKLQDDPSPTHLAGLLGDTTDKLIGGLDVPPNLRDQVIDTTKRKFVRNFFDGLILKGNWQGAQGVLDSGQLDAYLDPDAKKQYLRQARNAGEVAAQEVAAAAARQRSEAMDAKRAIDAKIDAGIVPTPEELRGVRGKLVNAKVDQADLIAFDAASIKVAVNQRYASADGTTIRRDRDLLAGKMAAGTASEADQVSKAQLDRLVDNADKRQADDLRDMLRQGVAGRVQALGAIRGTPEQRHDVAEKLETGLGAVANLGPRAQAAALDGGDVRKARPRDFGRAIDVDAAAKRALGGAIVGSLGSAYGQVRDVAWNIMSHNLAVNGRDGFDEGVYKTAVATAMGATLRPGGVLQGGVQTIRGRQVWLPSWQTSGEFDRQLSRTDFAGAVYANGAPVDKADVLDGYRPDYFGDDEDGNPLYHMVDASGGALRAKGGGIFVLRPKRPN